MKEKNKFLQIGSILMIVAAVVFIISVAVGMPQVVASLDFLKTTNLDGTQMMENAEKLNMTADQAIAFSSTIIYVWLLLMWLKSLWAFWASKKPTSPPSSSPYGALSSSFSAFSVWAILFLLWICATWPAVLLLPSCSLSGQSKTKKILCNRIPAV